MIHCLQKKCQNEECLNPDDCKTMLVFPVSNEHKEGGGFNNILICAECYVSSKVGKEIYYDV